MLNQRLLVSNKVNALDLSLIGIDIDSFEVRNYYPLIHEILNINDTVRIVEKTISIDNPHTSTITLGDLEKDIKKYNIQAKKGYAEAMKIAEEASNRVVSVEKYTTEQIYRVDWNINTIITDVGKEITNINNSLGSTSNDLTDINSNITILTNQVNKNTSDINNIESVLDNIELDIVTVKADLNILKADTTTINNKLDEILSILNGGA